MTQKYFEKMEVRKVQLCKPYNTYYVFPSVGDKVEISATSVVEALEKTGIKNALTVRSIFRKLYEGHLDSQDLKAIE